jgi:hypothetical protein
MAEKKYKYIQFIETEKKPKTSVYECRSISHGALLGTVKWYGPWRQYCFWPHHSTVFNDTCLSDIQDFLGKIRPTKGQKRQINVA